MPNIVFAELGNRLHKLGLTDKATAGATVEGHLGPINTTLVNSIGRAIKISSCDDGVYKFADEKVKEAVDKFMLDENSKPYYKSLREFVDFTTDQNSARSKGNLLASFENASNNLNFTMSLFTKDESFMTKPFKETVNCIEYATFISTISKIYFPGTEVRLLMFSNTKRHIRNVFEGLNLLDRHAYFIFKDQDGEVYLSVFGQKIRPINEGIDNLQRMYDKNNKQYGYFPDLIKKIQQEQSRL
ncbi:MAG: hypothetical protein UT13_C0001G0824 [Candidatus Pacebacteria bacterium GW2011_GWF2_38_9]|nr:MAG: hypothetical protein US01_C0001G0859 [candidate division TM6 bacterium GW2011_GWF2_28_16]KKQ07840.1 MAG: hypothetical protein US20_C0028G0019 [Candidatus Pacebacteria bacterium GW2011_GWF1_36_5]KKQ89176.1 MAG: hypothetical protein UT13_C0001G0824 [Candidatus Pacebacteria bacterium GW2011_GWF2_38_9]